MTRAQLNSIFWVRFSKIPGLYTPLAPAPSFPSIHILHFAFNSLSEAVNTSEKKRKRGFLFY